MKVQSPYQRIYCVQLVPQRKQWAAYVTHAISVFYWWLTGWNLNVLILLSSIVLPAHPTLYRVSLRASQLFDGIDDVCFFLFFFQAKTLTTSERHLVLFVLPWTEDYHAR